MLKFTEKPFGDDRLIRDKYMKKEGRVWIEEHEHIIVNGSIRNYNEDVKSERDYDESLTSIRRYRY